METKLAVHNTGSNQQLSPRNPIHTLGDTGQKKSIKNRISGNIKGDQSLEELWTLYSTEYTFTITAAP